MNSVHVPCSPSPSSSQILSTQPSNSTSHGPSKASVLSTWVRFAIRLFFRHLLMNLKLSSALSWLMRVGSTVAALKVKALAPDPTVMLKEPPSRRNVLSWPSDASMMSFPFPVNVLSPVPPCKTSLPSPALSLSFPSSPKRTSLPAPPRMLSFPAPPQSSSLPLLPYTLSSPAPAKILSSPPPPLISSFPSPV